MKEFREKHDIQAEEKMTQVNPLSSIPERVMSVREFCLLAFAEAENAFGEHMGSDFERAMANLQNADFSLSVTDAIHTISTRTSNGTMLSLSVDNNGITLLLSRDGKEDRITYQAGEITRKRQV